MLFPRGVEARANLGCVLAEMGKLELAASAFTGALALHGEYPDAHYHLAGTLDRARQVGALPAAVGGASACGSAFVLFLGAVRNATVTGWLIGLFSLSLGCTVCSLVMFLGDSVLAWHGLRREGSLPRPK